MSEAKRYIFVSDIDPVTGHSKAYEQESKMGGYVRAGAYESVCAERDRYHKVLQDLAAEGTQAEYPPCDLTLDQHIRAARNVLEGEQK